MTSTMRYLHDMLTVAVLARPMRSASSPLLFVPYVHTELVFSVAGPLVDRRSSTRFLLKLECPIQ